ncbi:MAG: ABC transporter permease [candidate division Zixibacteria bacterium]|nr:ABC transporter permease [candidate division Zixibacteria bacterium]MBU1472149.1 ABC transporter permease [candidate division Zixibacteria bacterium]MBU2625656.1 ABC transporter permease [candidate division Zixibacteria bacterium]
MKVWDIVVMSAQALRAHVLRTTLTILGVVIGVTSVIAIVSIIEGMNFRVAELINSMGPSSFVVNKGGIITSHEAWLKARKRKDLTMNDLRAIQDECESCYKVGARAFRSRAVKYGSEKVNDVLVFGGTYNFIDITEFEIGEGRMHSQFDDDHSRSVVLIGAGIEKELFPNLNPIGRQVKIGGFKYDVIGIAKERGAILGNDLDKFVVIPLTNLRKNFGTSRNLQLLISAKSPETLQETMDEVRMILRARRHVPYSEDDDFGIVTSDAFMAMYEQVTKAVRVTAIVIPAIALVVAGIVVMNIMMVSVTERTREIGIRKSLGARRKSILLQFVLEALLMSIAGGVIGIGLGLGSAKLLTDWGSLPFIISPIAVGGGICVSTGIGVIFGLYPALKGSKLDPVDAMRYET